MSINRCYFLVLFSCVLFSCFNSNNQQILASAYNEELIMDEILEHIPEEMEDSAFFVERYINNWIRTQLMIYNAEMNLSSSLKDYDSQIEKYRSSLLIFAYQQQLINQNLDTLIDKKEIEDYYEKYREEFILNKNIFQGRFIIIDKEAPKQERLVSIFRSEDIDDKVELLEYCQQFAKEYYLEDSSWQYLSSINSLFPEGIVNNEERFLRNSKNFQFEKGDVKYLLFIKEYKMKGSISPLSFEYDNIKRVILNKNKLRYLKKIEDELYYNALSSNKIKIY